MHAQFDNEEGGQNDRHKQARNYLLLMYLYVYPPSNPSIFPILIFFIRNFSF